MRTKLRDKEPSRRTEASVDAVLVAASVIVVAAIGLGLAAKAIGFLPSLLAEGLGAVLIWLAWAELALVVALVLRSRRGRIGGWTKTPGRVVIIRLLVAFGVVVVIIDFLALSMLSILGPSSPPRQALSRAQALLDLPHGQIDTEGLELMRVSSSPGSTNWKYSEDVAVSRSYQYSGEQGATCRRIVDEMRDAGVVFEGGEHECVPDVDSSRARGRIDCCSHPVWVSVTVYSHMHEPFRSQATLHLGAPFPAPDGPVAMRWLP